MKGLLIILLLLPFASALEQSSEYYMVGSKVFVKQELSFDEPFTGSLRLNLPPDVSSFTMVADNDNIEFSESFKLDAVSILKWEYSTSIYYDKGNFLANIKPVYDLDNLKIKVFLEEGTIIEKGEQGVGVFPRPHEIGSNGQNIILSWEFQTKKGEELPLYVRVKRQSKYGFYAFLFVIMAVLVYMSIIFLKKPSKKIDIKTQVETQLKVEKHFENEPYYFKNLKEDELQVARVLKLKEGSCEQGTLRIATGFSKAKLSRLLMEMEDRNLIKKEQRGKKNLIFLK